MIHHHHTNAPRRDRHQGGFTWSEFTLVAVISVVLLGLALWSVSGIRSDTRQSECQTALRSLKLAAESYRSATDTWPASNDVLVKDGYAKAEDLTGYRVTTASGATEPSYTATGECR